MARWASGIGATGLFCAVGVCFAGGAAAAEYPDFDGSMRFPAIVEPAAPEKFSWTVRLGENQELRSIDERTAAVVYPDDFPAFRITAGDAHDAHGAAVPTTLAVSAGDVITLRVHHRAGNPAAAGAPFVYPVIAGVGWEGGLQTHSVAMPPPEPPVATPVPGAVAAATCTVPRLRGRSLRAARRAAKRRGCRLGAVRGKRRRGARIVRQWRKPGVILPAGARVAVRLGSRKAGVRHSRRSVS